jgi:membrane-bound serine protease (ClpP class)
VRRRIAALCAVALGLLSIGYAQTEKRTERPASAKVVVIPVHGEISPPLLYILRRGLKEAIDNHVDTIVLDMETPGGRLDVTFDILKALEKFPGKTVTYVNREAVSAGAFISAGTDEIYFAPGAVIGAAAPVEAGGGDISTTMRSKLISYLKARVRAISEGKGYRGQVISAMIDENTELKIGEDIIKPKGELLSLTASEATKMYGNPPQSLLGAGIVEDLPTLLDRLHGAGNYSVETLQITWSEYLARYLNSVTPLLLGIGLVCLFIEFKTPGFGIFGITGIIMLGVLFFSQFTAGLSGHEPALVFLLGMVLLALEIFVLPGVMVLGIVGLALMIGSLIWAMTDLWPGEAIPWNGDLFLWPLVNVLGGVLLAVGIFFCIVRFLPQGGLWGRLVLTAAVGGEPHGTHALEGGRVAGPAVGKTGVAVTALFPSGQVEILGKRYEARLPYGFAEVGSSVVVTGQTSFGLAVEVIS